MWWSFPPACGTSPCRRFRGPRWSRSHSSPAVRERVRKSPYVASAGRSRTWQSRSVAPDVQGTDLSGPACPPRSSARLGTPPGTPAPAPGKPARPFRLELRVDPRSHTATPPSRRAKALPPGPPSRHLRLCGDAGETAIALQGPAGRLKLTWVLHAGPFQFLPVANFSDLLPQALESLPHLTEVSPRLHWSIRLCRGGRFWTELLQFVVAYIVLRLPRATRIPTRVDIPSQGLGVFHILGEELRRASGNQRGSHQGALLRHFLDGVHHVGPVGVRNPVEGGIGVDFPRDGVSSPSKFFHLPRRPGVDGIAEPLPVFRRFPIRS